MTGRAAQQSSLDVLTFQSGPYRFAIAATEVAYVHDDAIAESMPGLDLKSVMGVADDEVAQRALRIRSRHGEFDLRTGGALRVAALDRTFTLPAWLEEALRAVAVESIAFDGDAAILVLDADTLFRLAASLAQEART